jgi:hypothetical protein
MFNTGTVVGVVLIFFGSGFREILYLVSLGVELLDLPTSQKHLKQNSNEPPQPYVR